MSCRKLIVAVALCLAASYGCVSAVDAERRQAATVAASPEVRRALAKALLGGDAVDRLKLVASAEADERAIAVIILPRPKPSIGRRLDQPERFTFRRAGGDCFAVSDRDDRVIPLPGVDCVAAPD